MALEKCAWCGTYMRSGTRRIRDMDTGNVYHDKAGCFTAFTDGYDRGQWSIRVESDVTPWTPPERADAP